MPDNSEQIEFWNGPGGDRWVRHQEILDRTLEPFGRSALEAARAQPGERVVDVGCGCGWTSLALAEAVGPGGAVAGVDVSGPMLALARKRAKARSLGHATFAEADASMHPFEPTFDLIFSRFGVMFFRDPTAAFANLRRALRPGGRLAFICWGPVKDNPWFAIPMAAAGTVVPLPAPTLPGDPGPFAFGDRDHLRRVIEGAGFTGVSIEPTPIDYVVGPDLAEAATNAVETGPVSRLLVDVDEPTRGRVRTAIREALTQHVGPHGVVLPSSTWVVRA